MHERWVSWHRHALTLVLVAGVLLSTGVSARCEALTAQAAQAAFAEAQQLSAADGGHLWGVSLYGPMLFVDPATHLVVANEADGAGMLKQEGTVYTGRLPESMAVANTALEWAGKRWTMVQWPLPQNRIARERLLAHEMFHRVQPQLGLAMRDAINGHLEGRDGRVWMLLEWRALAAALVANGGMAQDQAVADAMLFRRHRQAMFPGAADTERELMLNEGMAEYTGVTLGEPDRASATWYAIGRLTAPSSTQSFVRSFAYTSGPAYGLLLDKRRPGWKNEVKRGGDPAELLSKGLAVRTADPERRAAMYGAAAVLAEETERAERTAAQQARYRSTLVTGPTVTLPILEHLNFSFDPGEVMQLGEEGTVYPSLHVSDDWGVLEATQGALVSFAKKTVRVAGPAEQTGGTIRGPGWELKLAAGWEMQTHGEKTEIAKKH